MKILQITRNFPPFICGLGDHTFHLSKELLRLGHDIEILTLKRQDIASDGFKVHFTAGFGLKNLLQNIKTIRKTQADIINLQYVPQISGVYGFSVSAGLMAFIIRLTMKSKLLVTFHELYVPFKGSLPNILLSIIQRLNFLLLSLCADKIIITTQRRKKQIPFLFRNKASVIPVGSNIPAVSITDEEKDQIKSVYFGSNEKIMMTFGTASRDKDYISILNFFSYLHRKDPGWRLLMAGDIQRDHKVYLEIKRTIENNGLKEFVRLTGPRSPEQISKLFLTTDLFIVNQTKGISTGSGTIACAFEHELPIVSNDKNMKDPFFEDQKNVIFVPMEDGEKTAEVISTMIDDSSFIETVKKRMAKDHDERLSWKAIAADYHSLFHPDPGQGG